MKLLINEPPLHILQSLVLKVRLKEAVLLLQLYFSLCNFQYKREGYSWVYTTYTTWNRDEIPFWLDETTIKTIRKLENKGYLY